MKAALFKEINTGLYEELFLVLMAAGLLRKWVKTLMRALLACR